MLSTSACVILEVFKVCHSRLLADCFRILLVFGEFTVWTWLADCLSHVLGCANLSHTNILGHLWERARRIPLPEEVCARYVVCLFRGTFCRILWISWCLDGDAIQLRLDKVSPGKQISVMDKSRPSEYPLSESYTSNCERALGSSRPRKYEPGQCTRLKSRQGRSTQTLRSSMSKTGRETGAAADEDAGRCVEKRLWSLEFSKWSRSLRSRLVATMAAAVSLGHLVQLVNLQVLPRFHTVCQ
jgi:hypothetical protein